MTVPVRPCARGSLSTERPWIRGRSTMGPPRTLWRVGTGQLPAHRVRCADYQHRGEEQRDHDRPGPVAGDRGDRPVGERGEDGGDGHHTQKGPWGDSWIVSVPLGGPGTMFDVSTFTR